MATEHRMEVSLRRIVVGYRAIAAVWLTVLGLIALTRDQPDRPDLVASAIVLVLVWTSVTLWVSFRAPHLLRTIAFLGVDTVITFGVLVAPDVAGAVDFYGGYPASTIFLAIYATGLPGALVTTLIVMLVALWRAFGPRAGDAVFALITSVVVYPFIAAPATWAVGVLRKTDRLRREAEVALDAERAERIRVQERAEVAAHLHDSVLQSLALIQRNPTDPDEVVAIARRQERDLRQWLYGQGSEVASFGDAVADVVGELEERFLVKVEAVVVGDGPLDPGLEALLAAGREAMINAAKHADVDVVSFYAEIKHDEAAVFVRDRGSGFDPRAVPEDRHGISESIHGRMKRSGGSARITSKPGDGTEVQLTLPRAASTREG